MRNGQFMGFQQTTSLLNGTHTEMDVIHKEKERTEKSSQRQQREIKEDMKKEQTEKNPAALQC